jgi:hypothetical protein
MAPSCTPIFSRLILASSGKRMFSIIIIGTSIQEYTHDYLIITSFSVNVIVKNKNNPLTPFFKGELGNSWFYSPLKKGVRGLYKKLKIH